MRHAFLIALLPLAACSQPSAGSDRATATAGPGGGASRLYDVAGFTGIALRGPDDVDVRVGSGFSVRAEGPAKQLDRLRIARDGDVLRIDRASMDGLDWGASAPVKVFVTMPRIATADLVGSGDLAIDRVEGQSFRLDASGSGDVAIAALGVDSADLTLAGSGALHAKGDVRRLSIAAAGSGDVDAGGLKAGSAIVSAAGTGSVRVVVTGSAKVSATGTGDIDLGAQARCTTRASGTGVVRCGG